MPLVVTVSTLSLNPENKNAASGKENNNNNNNNNKKIDLEREEWSLVPGL